MMRFESLPLVVGAVALILPSLACSRSSRRDASSDGTTGQDGMAGPSGGDLLFVPEGLPNTNVDGVDVGLTLAAFTLVEKATGPELYAAVRNDGDAPACQPGMTTDFYDKAKQRVTSAGSVLQSQRLYQLDDGTIIPCIAPGEIGMTASTDLDDSMVIAELGYLTHLFPSFTLAGVTPIAGLAVSDVQTVAATAGNAYTGELTNELGVTVSAAKVMIFPVNRVGRPLGVATGSATADIPAGGSWTFATSSVDDLGAGYVAFPAATMTP